MDQNKNAQGQPDWNEKKAQQPPDRSGDRSIPNRDQASNDRTRSNREKGTGTQGEQNSGDTSNFDVDEEQGQSQR